MKKYPLLVILFIIGIIGCTEHTAPKAGAGPAGEKTVPDVLSRGHVQARRCTACHGQQGISGTALYPSLAGRAETELKAALLAYRSGEKVDPLMSPQAKSLSDADIDLLSAYFAALPSGRN